MRQLGICLSLIIFPLVVGCAESSSSIPPAVREQLEKTESGNQATRQTLSAEPSEGSTGFSIHQRNEWSLQETVADALRRIGPAAVPSLTQSLKSTDSDLRLRAVEILGRMGPEAKDAIPDLIERLGDDDPRVRKAAVRALGQIGPSAAAAVPELIRILQSADDQSPRGNSAQSNRP